MGFLIFALRKLQLKRKQSQLEYRSVVLGQRVENIQEQEAMLQRALSGAKNCAMMAIESTPSIFNNLSGVNFGDQEAAANQTKYIQAMEVMQNEQSLKAVSTNFTNSLFENVSSSRLGVLKSQEDAIQHELDSNNSQMKYISAELQEVSKQEDQAAKDDAPKFGQG
ncbi:hypothetical protein KBA27_01830 [bacterium]|nr:hypothetical protein [bacterium]